VLDLKPETLEKLRVILKKDFSEEVNDQELHDIAFSLVGFYDTLMQCYCEDLIAEQEQNHEKRPVQNHR
jgi:hypothetical protein